MEKYLWLGIVFLMAGGFLAGMTAGSIDAKTDCILRVVQAQPQEAGE